ncbi:MAG: hypothetical protein ACRC1Z_15210 [Waterburya sp.]
MSGTVTQEISFPKSKQTAARAIFSHLEQLVAIADESHLEILVSALQPQKVSDEEIELAKEIAGDDYNEEPSWPLELANLHRYYQRRQELLARSLTSTEVAELLGCKTRKTVHDRLKAGSLLGIRDRGIYKFPVWQFDPSGDDGVIDGLPQVLKVLKTSDFTKLNWLTKPHLAFSGKTPIEMLKQGEVEDVIVEARAVDFL